MGSHHRSCRHESTPGPFPPLSPPSSSIPILHTRHDSSPTIVPFHPTTPPQLQPPPSPSQRHHHNNRHNRRESLPRLSLPPMSPPLTTSLHSRHDSYPGPFPLTATSPPSHPETPSFPLNNNNSTRYSHHHQQQQQLFRHESDPGILPSSSSAPPSPSSSSSLSSLNNYHFYDHHNYVVKRKLGLYDKDSDLAWPFGELHGLDHDDIRETAYEIFFTACRSSPGFGGRSNLTFYSKHESNGNGGVGGGHVPVSQTSRVKRALGLKMLRSSLSQRIMLVFSMPTSPVGSGGSSPRSRNMAAARPRRQMSMADVMRVQMQVSEMSDSRLRKTLMRTLVGQVSKKLV